MTSFVARRARNLILLGVAIVLFIVWHGSKVGPTHAPQQSSGWLLAGLVVFLALYNVRKKIAVVPLGSSAAWLQLHIYVGLFAVMVYFAHTGLHLPTGTLETVLAVLFLLVVASGIMGLIISRLIPPRLARRGEEVIFERIPAFIHQLEARAQRLALDSIASTRSRAIADYYAERVRPFFGGPRDRIGHVLGLNGAQRRRAHEMAEFRSCLGPDEIPVFDELAALVHQKEDLDFHRANQSLLKYWFFVHVPPTYALVLFIVTHVVLVYAFGSGR